MFKKILFSQSLHLSSRTILGHSGRQTLGGEVCDFNFKAPFPEQSFSVPHQLTARHSQLSLCLFQLLCLKVIPPLPPFRTPCDNPGRSMGLSHHSHHSACLSAPGAAPLSPSWPSVCPHTWPTHSQEPGCLHSGLIHGQARTLKTVSSYQQG